MTPPRASQGGFTLVEVLVALLLMAVLSLVSWRGLDSVTSIREHLERDGERDEAILRALGQLERDVRMRAPDHVLDGGALASAAVGPRLLPPAVALAQAGQSWRLDVVRTPAEGEGAWQRVQWWQQDGVLRRAAPPASDAYPLPDPESVPSQPVLTGVTGFSVRAYIPGRGWMALPLSANQAAQGASGLEFTLRLAANGQPPQDYRRVVSLP